jgi:hypothetical protein
MKKGDVVMIYADPIDRKIPIGKAKLIAKDPGFDLHSKVQQWKVRMIETKNVEHYVIKKEKS